MDDSRDSDGAITPVYPPPTQPMTPTPPAYGPPLPPTYSPPPSPSSSGKTVGLVVGIVAACVLVLGGLGVALFFVLQNAVTAMSEGLDDVIPMDDGEFVDFPDKLPLVEGEPGPTSARLPQLCPDTCFGVEDVGQLDQSEAAYSVLGVPVLLAEWNDAPDSTAQKEFLSGGAWWEDSDGDPAQCFPVSLYAPLSTALDARVESADDPVTFAAYHEAEDATSALNEVGRVFSDSASAEAHMADLLDVIAGCTEYDMGTGASYWTADVSPMPALTLPDSIAAVGWVEDSPFGRYYAVDLQRSNLVMRIMLYTDGSLTEEDYRDFVESYASRMAFVDPTG